MHLPDSSRLSIQSLSRVFSDMSESYKLFWFSGILDIVKEGKSQATYNDIINRMIINAWYMVSEYHLNLGPSDTLEKLVLHTQSISGLKTSAKEQEILQFLNSSNDSILNDHKMTLSRNVPYRFQAPFMNDFKGKAWNKASDVINRVNDDDSLIYHFGSEFGLNRTIHILNEWQSYLGINQAILTGWLEYNLITYLQKRNPSVPGISNKLSPPSGRKLDKAKKFWKSVIDFKPVLNIYATDDSLMDDSDISLDHFVPWSYVAHDELWNLVPTTRSYNSSKSNNLPNWDKYFPLLCDIEYISYEAIWQSELIHSEFEKCKREHVNSNEAISKLYVSGIDKEAFKANLKEILQPTYISAKNIGFGEWNS